MMMACVLVLSLRCINVYEHGCELGCVEVVDAVYSAFFFWFSLQRIGKAGFKIGMGNVFVKMFHILLAKIH